jgi:hypothetical protein
MLGKSVFKIYDENENEVDMDNINENMNIMTILEIQGVKCSARSFQIEIELKQMLVMNPINIFDKCLLTKKQQDVVNYSHQDNNTETINETLSDTILVCKNNDEFQREEIVYDNEPTDTVNVSDNLETEPEDVSEQDKEHQEPENKEPIIEISEKYLEKNENQQKFNMNTLEINKYSNGLEEVEFQLEELPETEIIQIKKRNEVYYEMYREARRKAKIARNLALSSYLEAKRIKNTYMLEDIKESDDSDLDMDLDNEDNNDNER